MKIILIQILLFLVMFGAGLLIVVEVKDFYLFPASADILSPLDFSADYNNFEARIGIKRGLGRYITLHYEFSE